MKFLTPLFLGFATLLLPPTPACADLTLAVNEGVTYYVTPQEIREKYKDLADAIGRTLKTSVSVLPVDRYPVLRKGLDAQQYDLALVHPAHHSLISLRDGKYRLIVLTRGYTEYKARFLVRKDAPMKQSADIKGKRIATPDPDSITAVITRATLRDLGIDAAKADVRTTRYQDAVPYFVENGFSDVGVTGSAAVAKDWQDSGGAVLFESKPVPIKHMIASSRMNGEDVRKLRELMLGLDKSDAGRRILEKIGYRGYEIGDEEKLAAITKWLGY